MQNNDNLTSSLLNFKLQVEKICSDPEMSDLIIIPDPKKISGRPDNLGIRVQIDWSQGKNTAVCCIFGPGVPLHVL